MLAVPARLGGLAITIPSVMADGEHKASLDLAANPVACIKQETNHQTSIGEATLISEVCFDTAIEPLRQPLTGETFR